MRALNQFNFCRCPRVPSRGHWRTIKRYPKPLVKSEVGDKAPKRLDHDHEGTARRKASHLSILSIFSNAISTPLINLVMCRGKSRFSFSLAASRTRVWSLSACSRAMGSPKVIRVSWIVSLVRPRMSKYDSSLNACCTSSSLLNSE